LPAEVIETQQSCQWINDRIRICLDYHSDWFSEDDTPFAIAREVYYPILWLDEEGPKPISDAIDWYAHLRYTTEN